MTKKHQAFDEALGIEPTEEKEATEVGNFSVPKAPAVETETPIDEDFEFARSQVKDLTLEGMNALSSLVKIIEDNDETKASLYDSVSTMINALTHANMALMGLHEKKANTNKKVASTGTPEKVVNETTNHFHGTTADLQDEIKKWKESQAKAAKIKK
jgi:hypothetical protein